HCRSAVDPVISITKVMVLRNNYFEHDFASPYDRCMPKRREPRLSVPIPVRLWGLDREGRVFSQNAKTLNIASNGARLFGVTANVERGFIVGLQCGNMRARFMVVWVGEKGTAREGQIGLRAAENGIWSVALPRASDEDYSEWLAEHYLEPEPAI